MKCKYCGTEMSEPRLVFPEGYERGWRATPTSVRVCPKCAAGWTNGTWLTPLFEVQGNPTEVSA